MNPLLLDLAQALRALPGSSDLRVFGSMLTRPDEAHDVDVGLLVDEDSDALSVRTQRVANAVLHLGAYGTSYYGVLDIFIACADRLLVRDDLGRSFTQARKARELRQAIVAGEPFDTWFERVVTPLVAQKPVDMPIVDAEDPHHEVPTPTTLRRSPPV